MQVRQVMVWYRRMRVRRNSIAVIAGGRVPSSFFHSRDVLGVPVTGVTMQ